MTWTYSGDPSSSDKDAVRFNIGDTDVDNQQMQDEEIEYLLSVCGSVPAASAKAARILAAKYARLADEETGEVAVKWSQISKRYSELADEIDNDYRKFSTPVPFGGGISNSDIYNRRNNPDRVAEQFQVGMFSDPQRAECPNGKKIP